MRQDIRVEGWRPFTVSERKVHCPKASTLGYGTYIARPGDWVTFQMYAGTADAQHPQTGRVLGRIEAPQDVAGWLYVLALSGDCCHLQPVWVDPDWVGTIQRPERVPAALLAWFTQPQLPEPRIVAKLAHYGTLAVGYIDNVEDRRTAFEHGVSPEGFAALLQVDPVNWPDTMLAEQIRRQRQDVKARDEDLRRAMATVDVEAVRDCNELRMLARARLRRLEAAQETAPRALPTRRLG